MAPGTVKAAAAVFVSVGIASPPPAAVVAVAGLGRPKVGAPGAAVLIGGKVSPPALLVPRVRTPVVAGA